MNCLSAMFKYLLYFLNLIFVIGGILLIVVGSIMLSTMGNFTAFEGAINTQTIPIIIITIGCVTFLVAFFGCCGTIRENACCTTIYAICMLVLFALQLALSIWIFAANDKFLDKMSTVVNTAWNENNAAQGYPMDALQLAFKCCGNTGYQQYESSVPASCCGYKDRNQVCEAAIYTQRLGCNGEFVDFWASNTDLIRWSSLIIALFELGIFIVSCCLASAMRKR
ncbi:23 kDa integral membrane protein [Drosophila persimilis]|uniref:Tetraspanin n=1 Tax=Drosophila pseudoobscura pseudoobscura TaxID=46245 RepID=A0A6I8USQ7_DROPS|nr:23 kDa integral membrane protein [Drosophila pseudoobscura]XP_026841511.1 23 kDa integral membrane protein [Drosophila persimilis]